MGTEKNDELVGTRQQVLVDARVGEMCYGRQLLPSTGRMERDAPEIDGQVVIAEGTPPVGSFVEVEITDAAPYELSAKVVGEKSIRGISAWIAPSLLLGP